MDFFSVHVYFDLANPLDKLEQISFIEFSFQDQGINYYSFVDLVQLDPGVSSCVLKLVSPQELYSYQNRRHCRKPLPPHTTATCRVIGARQRSAGETQAFKGQLLEISRSGTSMITPYKMTESLMLELSFHLPEVEAPLLLTGEVRSSTPFSSDSYRVGIEFHDVPLSSLNLIDTYCEQTSS
ncbi:PilZ domain-containing protein [Paenibacillus sp. 1P03SA]|uniref:PilZ domain-containing protein n=1 Tax=Paenibacillus sp. 1P03SA TaxID=3132294 RepID=UPI0039A36E3C